MSQLRSAVCGATSRTDWLGSRAVRSSLSSEPGGLAGLSVASHAGVLARSKISGSLLHRLSRPWTAWGQFPSVKRDRESGERLPPGDQYTIDQNTRTTLQRHGQRYIRRAAPKFSSPAAGDRSSSCALSNRRLSILLFRFSLLLLERNLRRLLAKAQTVLTNSLKLKQTHVREACVCWSSLNDPRVR